MVNLRSANHRPLRSTAPAKSHKPAIPKKRPKPSTSNSRASVPSTSSSKVIGPKSAEEIAFSSSSSSSSGEDSDDSDAYAPATNRSKKRLRHRSSESEPASRSPSPQPSSSNESSKPSSSSIHPPASNKSAKLSTSSSSAASTSNSKSAPLTTNVSTNNLGPKKHRRKAYSVTIEQITEIGKLFKEKQFPSYDEMIECGRRIELDLRQVRNLVTSVRNGAYNRFISSGLLSDLPCQMRAVEEVYQKNPTHPPTVYKLVKDLKVNLTQVLRYFVKRRKSDRAAGKDVPEFKFGTGKKEPKGVTIAVKIVLMAKFEINKNPSDDELEEMMETTGLTKQKIKNWFAARNKAGDVEVPVSTRKSKNVHLDRKKVRVLLFHFQDGTIPHRYTRAQIAQKTGLTTVCVYDWYRTRIVRKDPADILKINNILMKYYTDVKKNPSKSECERLAKKIKTRPLHVTCWFSRERFHERLRLGQTDEASGSETDDEDIENDGYDTDFNDSDGRSETPEEEQVEDGYGEIEIDGIPSDEELDSNHLIQYGDSDDEDEEDEEIELEEQQEDLGRNVEDYMNNLRPVRFKDNDNESCGDGAGVHPEDQADDPLDVEAEDTELDNANEASGNFEQEHYFGNMEVGNHQVGPEEHHEPEHVNNFPQVPVRNKDDESNGGEEAEVSQEGELPENQEDSNQDVGEQDPGLDNVTEAAGSPGSDEVEDQESWGVFSDDFGLPRTLSPERQAVLDAENARVLAENVRYQQGKQVVDENGVVEELEEVEGDGHQESEEENEEVEVDVEVVEEMEEQHEVVGEEELEKDEDEGDQEKHDEEMEVEEEEEDDEQEDLNGGDDTELYDSDGRSETPEEEQEEGYGEIEVDGIPSDEELDPNHLVQYGDSDDEDEEDEDMELEEQQEYLGRNVEDYMNNLRPVRFKDNDNESCGDRSEDQHNDEHPESQGDVSQNVEEQEPILDDANDSAGSTGHTHGNEDVGRMEAGYHRKVPEQPPFEQVDNIPQVPVANGEDENVRDGTQVQQDDEVAGDQADVYLVVEEHPEQEHEPDDNNEMEIGDHQEGQDNLEDCKEHHNPGHQPVDPISSHPQVPVQNNSDETAREEVQRQQEDEHPQNQETPNQHDNSNGEDEEESGDEEEDEEEIWGDFSDGFGLPRTLSPVRQAALDAENARILAENLRIEQERQVAEEDVVVD